jgi:hypothetical protein
MAVDGSVERQRGPRHRQDELHPSDAKYEGRGPAKQFEGWHPETRAVPPSCTATLHCTVLSL